MENSLGFVLELKRASSSNDLRSYIERSREHSVWIKSDVYLRTIYDMHIQIKRKKTNQLSELINCALAVLVRLY